MTPPELCSFKLEQDLALDNPPISFLANLGVKVDFIIYLLLTFLSSTFFLRRQMILTKANSTKLAKINPVHPRNQISEAI